MTKKNLHMGSRSYVLNPDEIDKFVEVGSIGNYALGYRDLEGTFIVRYVGRSDTDLNSRLKDHVNEDPEYRRFKFVTFDSAVDAYKLECQNYHDFDNLKNEYHPRKPDGMENKVFCPVCEQ